MSSPPDHPPTAKRVYLAACAIYKDEAPYLREWIEFHRLHGVERFFLYDNGSTDAHLEALAPYLDSEVVVMYDWPPVPGQLLAYEHCLHRHGAESRWIAFIDLDEYLFSPTGRPLPEVLGEYERSPGVAVYRATYGTSGHETRPEGLVVESYVMRAADDYIHNRTVKSVVDPARATVLDPRKPGNPELHLLSLTDGVAIDENHHPVEHMITDFLSFEKLRVNHYFTRSKREFREKFKTVRADTGVQRRPPDRPLNVEKMDSVLSHVHDDVLAQYASQLRESLERVEAISPASERA
jgi:glycosyl transferase family 92